MNPWAPFIAFLVVGGVWTIAWGWAVGRAGSPPVSYDSVSLGGGRVRRGLFAAVAFVLVVVFVASIWWLPYRGIAAARLGTPQMKVTVTARMWEWSMSQRQIPAGVPVEFDVTSVDVNHGFGIYSPSGQLAAQVQAMPGYTNHLVVRLNQPGTYVVRCLEYCGVPHIVMTSAFEVR